MRYIPAALQAHLDSGTTTLCHCWLVMRRDGQTLGFTDHDHPLSFDGITFGAENGLQSGALETATGLAADNLDVLGALSSAAITETDLESGRYDDAEVDLFLVNWRDPNQRVLIFRGSIGETTRGPIGFRAELRGMAHRLDQPMGRVFQRQCDAELGDTRCGVLLTPVSGTVTSTDGIGGLHVTGFETQEDGSFTQGLLRWTSGTNTGQTAPIRRHASGYLALWTPSANPPQPGDRFTATPGCDKSFTTCRDRFANTLNFRGFPHMPGDDWLTRYPSRGELHDGAPLA